MRILHVSGPLHREFGGPPMASTGAAASLAQLGHKIKVIVCGQSKEDIQKNSEFYSKLTKSGAEVEILERVKISKYGTLIRIHEMHELWKSINDSEFIILHQVFQLHFIAIIPMLILSGKRYAVMPHGTLTTYQRKQHKFRKALFHPAIRKFLNSSAAIFVASEQEKKQLPSYLIDRGKVVGLGIDTQNSRINRSMNSTENFNLLYMGRITKKKNLGIALQAFAKSLKNSNLKMKFIVCGSGEEVEINLLKKLVHDLKISDEVEFRGWVSSVEKERAFLESNCFILTSEDENFAIAVAEALSYGVPCILSSNVALANLVFKHRAGYVIEKFMLEEIEEAITRASYSDRELAKESALMAASEIEWNFIALKWESNIVSLVQGLS